MGLTRSTQSTPREDEAPGLPRVEVITWKDPAVQMPDSDELVLLILEDDSEVVGGWWDSEVGKWRNLEAFILTVRVVAWASWPTGGLAAK